jgi:hypothetical protein
MLFLAVPSRSLVRAGEITVQVVTVLGQFPHLSLLVRRPFAEELDGNAHELFSGAALVNARQLLCVRPAEELRQLETGQASHVLHCDELEATRLPVPGHASRRVRDGPSVPLTAAVTDTAAQAALLRVSSTNRNARPETEPDRSVLYRHQKLPLLRPRSIPKR